MRARRCTRERRFVLPITSRSPSPRGARAGTRAARRAASARAKRDVSSSRRMPRPEPGLGVHGGPVRAVRHLVGAGAEQDEVAVAQPLEERDRLLDLVGARAPRGRLHAPRPCASTMREHRREVADGDLQLAERLAHGGDERLALRPASSCRSSSRRITDSRAERLARVGDAHDATRRRRARCRRSGAAAGGRRGPRRCTAARTVSTRNGASRHVELERRAGGRRVDHAHGHRLAGRGRRRSRRGRTVCR